MPDGLVLDGQQHRTTEVASAGNEPRQPAHVAAAGFALQGTGFA
jgi:hypothetical protein